MVIVIIGVLVIVGTYLLLTFETKGSPIAVPQSVETDGKTEQIEDKQINELEHKEVAPYSGDVGSQINTIHEHYNDVLTYKRWRSFEDEHYRGWESEAEIAKQILSTIEDMNTKVDDKGLRTDLMNAKKLINISIVYRDTTAMLYLHRIFHDLDVKYNNYDEKLWGYSYYGHEGGNVQKVEKHMDLFEE